MPMWAPPTPPQDDNDVYLDRSMCFMYEPLVMLESRLPAIYIKKEFKRIRIDPAIAVARKHKVRKEEHHRVPRSLFDRPQSLLRKERDLKLMKLKQFAKPLKPPLLQSRPLEAVESQSDWLVHEDWALLQALQVLQELPLTLTTDSPAMIPNWDLVADMVNACSRTYRSIKQCKNRYENVIVPREEGKILYDVNPRKQKKSKGIYKTKNNRPMRTSQLFLQDNSNAITSLYTQRFDSCKSVAGKRTPTIRPTLANPTLKNPKHAAVLAENGINYEQPLTPTQVAANRAERIAKEKQKNQEAAQQLAAVQRTSATTPTVTTTQTVAIVTAALAGTTTVQTVSGQQLALVQGSPMVTAVTGAPTTVVVTAAGLQKGSQGSAVAALSLARTIGPTGSIVVNPASANPFAAINKRIAGQTVVGSVGQTLSTTTANSMSIAQAVRAARTGTTQMTVQELAAVVNQSPARLGAHCTAQVITTTTLTPAQIIAAQKSGTVTVSNITAGALSHAQIGATTKTLTPQQLQILRLKQQQLRRLTAVQAAQSQTVTGVGQLGVQKSLSITTPLITSISQAQMSTARLQLAKQPGIKGTTVTRSLSEAEMAMLLKRQQLQQQRALSGATIVTHGSQALQQVQVSQGPVARLTTAQILTGTQVQHLQAGTSGVMSSGAQPVATLVKTVSTQGSATIPSVTIPVTAVSLGLGISVNVPTQKAIAGKSVTQQQMRQIQLQQLQQRNKLQVAAQQKVATLGQLHQVAKGNTTPLIMTSQQQTNLPKVMVQQIHQIVKQQPTIQQIIASVPQTTTATVIATQLVSQSQPSLQTVTKMSVPTGTVTSSVAPASRVSTQLTVPSTVTGTTLHGVTTGTLVTGTPTVSLTQGQGHTQTTLVKNLQLQDVIGQQKALTAIQQVKTVQQASAAVRQIQAGTVSLAQISAHTTAPSVQVQQLTSAGQAVTVTTTPKILQASPIVQQLVQPAATIAQIVQPSPGVQQAVQKVVQEAQAQAQHRVAVTIGGTTMTHPSPVTQSTVVVTGSQPQTIQQLTTQQLTPQQISTQQLTPQQMTTQQITTQQMTTQQMAPQQIITQQQMAAQQMTAQQMSTAGAPGQSPIPGQDQQGGKNSPYSMRLRNQRT